MIQTLRNILGWTIIGTIVLFFAVNAIFGTSFTEEQKATIAAEQAAKAEKIAKEEAKSSREFECKWAIKKNLKDPDSMQVITAMHLPLVNGGTRVLMQYRAKNSFGGYVVNEQFCDFDPIRTA